MAKQVGGNEPQVNMAEANEIVLRIALLAGTLAGAYPNCESEIKGALDTFIQTITDAIGANA